MDGFHHGFEGVAEGDGAGEGVFISLLALGLAVAECVGLRSVSREQ